MQKNIRHSDIVSDIRYGAWVALQKCILKWFIDANLVQVYSGITQKTECSAKDMCDHVWMQARNLYFVYDIAVNTIAPLCGILVGIWIRYVYNSGSSIQNSDTEIFEPSLFVLRGGEKSLRSSSVNKYSYTNFGYWLYMKVHSQLSTLPCVWFHKHISYEILCVPSAQVALDMCHVCYIRCVKQQ